MKMERGLMFKMPWSEPLERGLKPYQGVVSLALVGVVLFTVCVVVKGNATGKTAWLVWMVSP